MIEQGTCKTCKHWCGDTMTDRDGNTLRECVLTRCDDRLIPRPEGYKTNAWVEPGSPLCDTFFSRPGFGCNQHEEKEYD